MNTYVIKNFYPDNYTLELEEANRIENEIKLGASIVKFVGIKKGEQSERIHTYQLRPSEIKQKQEKNMITRKIKIVEEERFQDDDGEFHFFIKEIDFEDGVVAKETITEKWYNGRPKEQSITRNLYVTEIQHINDFLNKEMPKNKENL